MAEAQTSGAAPAKRVLVVDDDADICVALEMILRYEGYEVWTAKSAKLALARIDMEAGKDRRPAVIFSDVKMPEMDGLQFLEELRQEEEPPPVVMISGHGDIGTAVEAVKLGAIDFLVSGLICAGDMGAAPEPEERDTCEDRHQCDDDPGPRVGGEALEFLDQHLHVCVPACPSTCALAAAASSWMTLAQVSAG